MADKIFRVNMTDLSTSIEDVPADWAGHGGRGLTSNIVATEVPPTCHPLGPNNKLIFAPGTLSGTAASNSGRISAGAEEPRSQAPSRNPTQVVHLPRDLLK